MGLCSKCAHLTVKDVDADDEGKLIPEFECFYENNLSQDKRICDFFRYDADRDERLQACTHCTKFTACNSSETVLCG